jgi:hypothetical protein
VALPTSATIEIPVLGGTYDDVFSSPVASVSQDVLHNASRAHARYCRCRLLVFDIARRWLLGSSIAGQVEMEAEPRVVCGVKAAKQDLISDSHRYHVLFVAVGR